MFSGKCLSLLYESATVAPNRINEAIMRAQPATAMGVLAPADALKKESIAAFFTSAFLKTPAGSSTFVNVTAAS
tara:strand:+ start:1012 stop:1233 length:222 start_codon:yes stop_codon:yes gene_type:complete